MYMCVPIVIPYIPVQPMSPILEIRPRRGDRRPPRADVPGAWDDSNWAIAGNMECI